MKQDPVVDELQQTKLKLQVVIKAVELYFAVVRHKYNMKADALFSEDTMNSLETIIKTIKEEEVVST